MNRISFGGPVTISALALLTCLLPGCTVNVQSPPPPPVEPEPVYATAAVQPPQVEYVPPEPAPAAAAVVEVHAESDFYQPLSPYGRWIDVEGYGRCWTPSGVDQDWRPYTQGHWERIDAGWYWVSDEPWGWATCHYGRWHQDDQAGWVWVPQTQWAPAWVAWRQGGGYVGWAPLPPENHQEDPGPRAFVFVEQGRMLERQRPQTVIINNTTIIQKTEVINQTVIINKTVVMAGPRPEAIAAATGRKMDVVSARNLRSTQEAPALQTRRAPTAGRPVTPPGPAYHSPDTSVKTVAPARPYKPNPPGEMSPAPVQTQSTYRPGSAAPVETRRESERPPGEAAPVRPPPSQPHGRTLPDQTRPAPASPPSRPAEHQDIIKKPSQPSPNPPAQNSPSKPTPDKKKKDTGKPHANDEKNRPATTPTGSP